MTYRKSLEKKGWHRPWPIRILSVILGFGLFYLGAALWALETEYGGDNPSRKEYIVYQEEGGPVQVQDETGVVFEGTQEEVDQWLESQRGSRNYTVSILLFAASAILAIIGIAPSRRKKEGSDGVTPIEVRA